MGLAQRFREADVEASDNISEVGLQVVVAHQDFQAVGIRKRLNEVLS